ncbi:MAG: alpha/beta hydrolase [Paramuribaculum sp.]|nr:alpha/beta hydrolase [Paramuribaculum sp.]
MAQNWHSDILGGEFEMRYVNQGYGYNEGVRCTLVRLLASENKGRAVVYIHGFNDYFFQSEMAERFVAQGYNFYAVDLRNYGRSIMKGQRKFDIRSMNEYFPDVDSVLTAARRGGNYEIVLMGHSTGGLLASYYLACNSAAPVDALILNSPFLDWNLGWKEHLVPFVSALGRVFPNMSVPQGDSDIYSQSLLRSKHGEWNFNTDWKLPVSPDVTTGWVRAIDQAQDYLHHHKYSINVPVLLMYSSASSNPEQWGSEASCTDIVLDVKDIRHYGMMLGRNVTPVVVKGGIHDLVLSKPMLRNALYKYMFEWLEAVK